MTFIAAAIVTSLRTFLDFWNRLPSPIKTIIIGLLIALVSFNAGENRGARKQIAICNAEKQASINEAARIDREANQQAISNMKEQSEKYRREALDAENQLNKARDFYATLPDQCKSTEEFINRNNAIGIGDGVQQHNVPGSKKNITPRK